MYTKEVHTYFRNYILQLVDLSIQEFDALLLTTCLKEFKKEQYVFSCNELCKEVYFIINGSVRYSLLNHKQNKIIFNFKFENNFVTSYSMLNNFVAKFDVICNEDCKVLSIPLQSIIDLRKKSHKFEMYIFSLINNNLIELVNYIADSLSKNVLERFDDIETKFLNINQRLPQYLIANYLGVTNEHLSRLKKSRISLNKK